MSDQFSRTLLRGLTVVLPIAATVWTIRWLFLALDGALFPGESGKILPHGIGVLSLLVVAVAVGGLARSRPTQRYVEGLERALERIPIVKLVYGTIKDLVDAFLGKRKRFDKPVLVRIGADLEFEVLGFVTCDDLSVLGMPGKCAVYFPQSYTFGGNLVFLPRQRLVPFGVDSAAAMSFVMSGGVSTLAENEAAGRAPNGILVPQAASDTILAQPS